MENVVTKIFDLFAAFGAGFYGEDLSLKQHMLQTATQARVRGASESLIVAALLHDVGHFLHADAASAVDEGRDLAHEAMGAAWLTQFFGPDITEPIALHVQAKRYLCGVESIYFDGLSNASRLSLEVQGGRLSQADAAVFIKQPHAEAAVLLRRCDDAGKDVSVAIHDLEHYRDLLVAHVRQPA